MKHCSDCKHGEVLMWSWVCRCPALTVTGAPTSCENNRRGGACGVEAQHFEPRPIAPPARSWLGDFLRWMRR